MNQFLVIAAAEKMAALVTEDYLTREAQQGKRADFERSCKRCPMSSQRTTTVSKRPRSNPYEASGSKRQTIPVSGCFSVSVACFPRVASRLRPPGAGVTLPW